MKTDATPIFALILGLTASGAAGCAFERESESEFYDEAPLQTRTVTQAATGTDTLYGYIAKCEEATGIQIPSFRCEDGVEVPQGTQFHDGWLADINVHNGAPANTGDRNSLLPTRHEMIADGGDIWGAHDSFTFSYLPVNDGHPSLSYPKGDDYRGEIYVELFVEDLSSDQGSGGWAKVGPMFRAGSASNAANVALVLSDSQGIQLQYRSVTGAGSTNRSGSILTGLEAPVWLRLERKFSGPVHSFTGYASKDRVEWTQVGDPVSVGFAGTTPVFGMALASHGSSQSTTALVNHFAFSKPEISLADRQKCDNPQLLKNECDPGGRFQVLDQTEEAMVVANCRVAGAPNENQYLDVAVIQYNMQSGGVCFYQNGIGAVVSGDEELTLHRGKIAGNWRTPQEVHDVGCPRCHDNGGFLRSPYFSQLRGEGFAGQGDLFMDWLDKAPQKNGKLRYVGLDFSDDRTFSVHPTTNGTCVGCHDLSVHPEENDLPGGGTGGTARRLTEFVAELNPNNFQRTEHSPTAPPWMTIDFYDSCSSGGDCSMGSAHGVTTQAGAWAVKNCADNLVMNGDFPEPRSGCNYLLNGQPFHDQNLWLSMPIPNTVPGSYEDLGYEDFRVKAAGKDIWGTSDEMYFRGLLDSPGDGTATVRLKSLVRKDDWTKAGLMIRQSAGPTSANAMALFSSSRGPRFQYRKSDGASTANQSTGDESSNTGWLRVTRVGTTFLGYYSTNGSTWQQFGPPVHLPGFVGTGPGIGLAVTSHNPGVLATAVFSDFTWTPAGPSTYVDQLIGSTVGSYDYLGTTHVLTNRGNDLWNQADQVTYAFRALRGDGSITAEVEGLDATHRWAKAGVMIRASMEPGSINAAMLAPNLYAPRFQYRSTENMSTSGISGTAEKKEIRLVREGNWFRGYAKNSSGSWVLIGQREIANFPSTALVGLVLTSHNTGSTATARFRNVVVVED